MMILWFLLIWNCGLTEAANGIVKKNTALKILQYSQKNTLCPTLILKNIYQQLLLDWDNQKWADTIIKNVSKS